MLRERVEQGLLPPVEERLPENPYVVEPVESIGKYGGTIRLLTMYADRPLGVAFVGDSYNGFVNPLPDGSGVVPHFVEAIEESEDKTTYTFHLRRGVRWSDGHPFTADDVMFWYEDYLNNSELVPAIPSYWQSGGEVVKVSKIDDYTVVFSFKEPQPLFLRMPLSKAPMRDRFFLPKHYMKDFHPNYTPLEELDARAKAAGFDSWRQLFLKQLDGYTAVSMVPGVPVLTPFVPVTITSTHRVFERNPYYWKVDSAGNQLPYIDRVVVDIVSDAEVATGKMISGEIDFDGFATDISNYPLYKQHEEEGDYRTILWDSGMGSEVIFFFNLTHDNTKLREVFREADFRRAASLGINRQEINELLYFGNAQVRQYTVVPSSRYYEPEFANAYVEYDPDEAKRLLDGIGLIDRNGDGWRDYPDGSEFTFTIEYTTAENPLKQDIVQLVTEYWRELGLKVNNREISGSLFTTRFNGNLLEASIANGDRATDVTFPSAIPYIGPGGNLPWPKFADVWLKGQAIDQEIPAEAQRLWELYQASISTVDEAEHIRITKDILASQAENLWVIGTVGMAPHAVIVNKDLRNVPEDGLWCWDTHWTMSVNPEQFYFDR
jgi:peptide/nickel transport system substrate-binding protein